MAAQNSVEFPHIGKFEDYNDVKQIGSGMFG